MKNKVTTTWLKEISQGIWEIVSPKEAVEALSNGDKIKLGELIRQELLIEN